MASYLAEAAGIISRCRRLASHSEDTDGLRRTFLSPPMHQVHAEVGGWMERAGMHVRIDQAGNIRGCYPGPSGMPEVDTKAPRLIVGSHLDTVPHAGAFDGPLGVLLGIALVESLGDRKLKFAIEVIGFSEEEGIRFGVPFIGSRAVVGDVDDALLARRDSRGISIAQAIRDFGLDPSRMGEARVTEPVLAFLEMHIEQGPMLDALGLSLGVVKAIAGQSRLEIRFHGEANHAGTTPMHLRRDALSGAAEWIASIEREAAAMADLVATIGRIEAQPGAANIIPGVVTLTLDVRHPGNDIREQAVERFLTCGREIAGRRGLTLSAEIRLSQPSVDMDKTATVSLARAVQLSGRPVHLLHSGAGHDAMIMARRMPAAMLFLRSPGGISHHPDETVMVEDVAAALDVASNFLNELERTT